MDVVNLLEAKSLPTENKQGVFDRQLEMCATFVNFNFNKKRVFDYNVDNNGIEIYIFYDKLQDWFPDTGKKQLIDLVKHYKLHLIGYEIHKIHFLKNIGATNKYKHTCKYIVPLNLLKFNCKVFYYDTNYITYDKIVKPEKFKLF